MTKKELDILHEIFNSLRWELNKNVESMMQNYIFLLEREYKKRKFDADAPTDVFLGMLRNEVNESIDQIFEYYKNLVDS